MSFANSDSCILEWCAIITFPTTPPVRTTIDILEKVDIPILLSLPQMQNLGFISNLEPESVRLTCELLYMKDERLPIPTSKHVVVDLARIVGKVPKPALRMLDSMSFAAGSLAPHESRKRSTTETGSLASQGENEKNARTAGSLAPWRKDKADSEGWFLNPSEEAEREVLAIEDITGCSLPEDMALEGDEVEGEEPSTGQSKEGDFKGEGFKRKTNPTTIEDRPYLPMAPASAKPKAKAGANKRPNCDVDAPVPGIAPRGGAVPLTPEAASEPRKGSKGKEPKSSLDKALEKIHEKLSDPAELLRIHLKHHHMNLQNFKARTSMLRIPQKIYDAYEKIVKCCESCQRFHQAPERSRISGMRAM